MGGVTPVDFRQKTVARGRGPVVSWIEAGPTRGARRLNRSNGAVIMPNAEPYSEASPEFLSTSGPFHVLLWVDGARVFVAYESAEDRPRRCATVEHSTLDSAWADFDRRVAYFRALGLEADPYPMPFPPRGPGALGVARADRIAVRLSAPWGVSGRWVSNVVTLSDKRRPIRSKAPADWPHRPEGYGRFDGRKGGIV